MYDIYKDFREKYPVGCGTTVTDSVKHGLDYCDYTQRMKKLYNIQNEAELINVSIYVSYYFRYLHISVINMFF